MIGRRTAARFLAAAALACAPDVDETADAPAAASGAEAAESAPRYVGSKACGACHSLVSRQWKGSHHQLAMQTATPETVQGDFADAAFTHLGASARFFRRDGRFFVHTEGPAGTPGDFEIAYAFGVDPLQQYLVRFPDGRLQALTIAWDTRSAAEGGQRWFSLYPDEAIPPGDRLHWTGIDQNWNHQCGECHATGYEKGYDDDDDRFETRASAWNVGCEACHGPGSAHVAWARAQHEGGPEADDPDPRLAVDFGARATWRFEDGAAIAVRGEPSPSRAEVETCGRCHARRSTLSEEAPDGGPLLDTHRVALLDEGLYHADGQIQGEVYVYASFLQSRMARAGVTCSDCHEPHSLALRAEGNALCGLCHAASRYDSVEHHHHELGSEGAQCVSCHMPARTFMVLDARRDHGFRVPRPDLGAAVGAPDACTGCHAERSQQWAADAIAGWGGARPEHFATAIHAGRRGLESADSGLLALLDDPEQPGIVRATAMRLLAHYPSPRMRGAIERAARDEDPLVRMAASASAEALDPVTRLRAVEPLLSDPVRAVRLEAAAQLAGVPARYFAPAERRAHARAVAEYRAVQRLHADRPPSHLNLGVLHAAFDEREQARREYERALRIDPDFTPALVNLVDLLRLDGRDDEGERRLRAALARRPDEPTLHHVLGLLLVRQRRLDEALVALERAATLAPEQARFAYVYGVALHTLGRGDESLSVLETARRRHPTDREILLALATLRRDRGELDAAREAARRLHALAPEDDTVRTLLAELERGTPASPGSRTSTR